MRHLRHLIFAVTTGLLALVVVLVSLSPVKATSSSPLIEFTLNSPYDGSEVDEGDTVAFTALLTNSAAVSHTYIYALSIPQGTMFVAAGDNLQRHNYPVGAVDTSVKSLTWEGEMTPQQQTLLTFTLQITGPGALPGGDIPVTGAVFDSGSGKELSRKTITLDWPGAISYLPVILKSGGQVVLPTPTPTSTPTPMPSTSQLTPTIAGVLQSQASTYNEALNGEGFVDGSDLLYDKEPYQYPTTFLSLVQCNFMELVYMVHRTYLEYDTRSVEDFSSAYLVFRNNTAYPGPPSHSVEIYQGTWTQLLSGTHEIDPGQWDAHGALIETVPGNIETLPVTATVIIPAGYINAGGVTKVAVKTSTEGTAPPLNSCFGGPNPGLGASISLPYLYIVP